MRFRTTIIGTFASCRFHGHPSFRIEIDIDEVSSESATRRALTLFSGLDGVDAKRVESVRQILADDAAS